MLINRKQDKITHPSFSIFKKLIVTSMLLSSPLLVSTPCLAGVIAVAHGFWPDGSETLFFGYGATAMRDVITSCVVNTGQSSPCKAEGPFTDNDAHVYVYNTKTKKNYSATSANEAAAVASATALCVAANSEGGCTGSGDIFVLYSKLDASGATKDVSNLSDISVSGTPVQTGVNPSSGYNYYTWTQNCYANGVCDTSGQYTYHWAPAQGANGVYYTDH